MSIKYKTDVLAALKAAGYSTYRLRNEKLLSEGVIQSLRDGTPISFDNISKVCSLLGCEVGDILVYIPD